MIARDFYVRYEKGETIHINTVTDLHLGEWNADLAGFERWVWKIANVHPGPTFVLGDMASYIGKSDPRWNSGGIDEDIIKLRELDQLGEIMSSKVAELLNPIRHLIVDWDDGNHEDTHNKYKEGNVGVAALAKLGRTDAYSADGGITTLKFDDGNKHVTTIDVSHTHGHVAGRTTGSKVNAIEAESGWLVADIYLRGHSHSKFVLEDTRLRKVGRKLVDQNIALAHCGSWLKTRKQDVTGADSKGIGINRASYSEKKGYRPTVLGNVKLDIEVTRDGWDLV